MKTNLKLKNKEDIEKISDLIKNNHKIILINHRRMDGDCLGSLMAFYEILKQEGKEINVINEGLIPNEFNFLNISNNLFKTDFDIIGYNPDLIISFDAADTHQLGEYYFNNKKYFDEANLLVIDHHISNPAFGRYNLIEPEYSSTCEICYLLLEKLNLKDKITPDIATYLLMGIITDTNSFFNTNTNSETLKVSSFLLDLGARHQEIIINLFKKKSFNKMKLWGKVIESLKDIKDKKIIWNIIPRNYFKQTNTTDKDLGGLIDEFLTTIDTMLLGFFLYELEDGSIKATFRSKTDLIDTSILCEKFGGGGHKRASGFLIKDKNIYEVETLVINEISKLKI